MEVNTVLYCFIHSQVKFLFGGGYNIIFKTSREGVKQQADWQNQCWVETFPSLPLDLLTLLLSPIVHPCTGRLQGKKFPGGRGCCVITLTGKIMYLHSAWPSETLSAVNLQITSLQLENHSFLCHIQVCFCPQVSSIN